jgi:hypothetical protein
MEEICTDCQSLPDSEFYARQRHVRALAQKTLEAAGGPVMPPRCGQCGTPLGNRAPLVVGVGCERERPLHRLQRRVSNFLFDLTMGERRWLRRREKAFLQGQLQTPDYYWTSSDKWTAIRFNDRFIDRLSGYEALHEPHINDRGQLHWLYSQMLDADTLDEAIAETRNNWPVDSSGLTYESIREAARHCDGTC